VSFDVEPNPRDDAVREGIGGTGSRTVFLSKTALEARRIIGSDPGLAWLGDTFASSCFIRSATLIRIVLVSSPEPDTLLPEGAGAGAFVVVDVVPIDEGRAGITGAPEPPVLSWSRNALETRRGVGLSGKGRGALDVPLDSILARSATLIRAPPVSKLEFPSVLEESPEPSVEVEVAPPT